MQGKAKAITGIVELDSKKLPTQTAQKHMKMFRICDDVKNEKSCFYD